MAIRVTASGGRKAPQPQNLHKKAGRPTTRTSALIPAAAQRTPAASRLADGLTPDEQQLSGDAVETFIRVIGGRDALLDTLAIAGDTPEVERVTNTLLDPRYASWSMRRVCQLVGITVADLFSAYRKALVVRAHLKATVIIADKLPPIVEDVMLRATPSLIRCPDCRGTRGPTICVTCGDTGQVMSEPDLDRQKLALELGQLTSKGGPSVLVQQNAHVLAGSALVAQGTGALEQLHQAVGNLLFTPDRHRDVREALATPAPPVAIDVEPVADPA